MFITPEGHSITTIIFFSEKRYSSGETNSGIARECDCEKIY
jgi:hypothetical protein